MSADPCIEAMKYMFAPWRHVAATLPPISALTPRLEEVVKFHRNPARGFDFRFTPADSKYFASAAVDMWHRAVHSLLISAALTRESTLWSSVSGYYTTHYTFRALAHLMGYYQLFQLRWMVSLRMEGGHLIGAFRKGREREHDWYRNVVSKLPCLNSDPFFTSLKPSSMIDVSHRDRANYVDHLGLPPNLQDINREAIRIRMQQLARIEVLTPGPTSGGMRLRYGVPGAAKNTGGGALAV